MLRTTSSVRAYVFRKTMKNYNNLNDQFIDPKLKSSSVKKAKKDSVGTRTKTKDFLGFGKSKSKLTKKQKRRREIIRISSLMSLIISLVIGSLTFVVGFAIGGNEDVRDALGWDVETDSDSSVTQGSNGKLEVNSTEEESAMITAVEATEKSVVSISVSAKVTRTRSLFEEFFGDPYSQTPSDDLMQEVGSGSGFIVSENGLIVTNKHVVEGFQDAEFTVFTTEANKDYKAKVVAVDPTNDLALLDIDGDDFEPIKLGDSESLKVGQTVIAIGNAIGQYRNTVSRGVISGLQREITAGDETGRFTETLSDIIQTDAAINAGNSGGPLINLSGEVIGVNVARSQTGENIGFAIPVKEVIRAVDSYNKDGKIIDDRGFLGVSYLPVDKNVKANYDLDVDYGALIIGRNAIWPDSAADKAGLKIGDVILEIDGEKLEGNVSLASLIDKKKVGDKIELKYARDGDEKEVKVELGRRPTEAG